MAVTLFTIIYGAISVLLIVGMLVGLLWAARLDGERDRCRRRQVAKIR